jgi:heat shock protein HtpX
MIKRIFLFLLTNLLVIATISIIMSVLGVKPYLSKQGIDYRALLIFCLIWGIAGSFISLLLSKFMAKMAMGVVIIDPQRATHEERFLIDIVYSLSRKAGLSTMPEVGIYNSPELNAFATGPSRRNSLVAVSSGLLHSMNRDEIEGVLGHEIAHVANGDMVTMTLVQGVINAFAMFLSRIAAYAVSIALSRGEDKEGGISNAVYFGLTFVFDILFTLLGSILVAAFSRAREYRADVGGAQYAGREKMVAALAKLQRGIELQDDRAPNFAAFKISHRDGWLAIFATHPPLEERIARLQKLKNVRA